MLDVLSAGNALRSEWESSTCHWSHVLESWMSPLRQLLEQNLPAVLFSRGIQNDYDECSISIGSGLVV